MVPTWIPPLYHWGHLLFPEQFKGSFLQYDQFRWTKKEKRGDWYELERTLRNCSRILYFLAICVHDCTLWRTSENCPFPLAAWKTLNQLQWTLKINLGIGWRWDQREGVVGCGTYQTTSNWGANRDIGAETIHSLRVIISSEKKCKIDCKSSSSEAEVLIRLDSVVTVQVHYPSYYTVKTISQWLGFLISLSVHLLTFGAFCLKENVWITENLSTAQNILLPEAEGKRAPSFITCTDANWTSS